MQFFAALQHETVKQHHLATYGGRSPKILVKRRQGFVSTISIDNIVICVTMKRDPRWTGFGTASTLPAELTCRLDRKSGVPADVSTESTGLLTSSADSHLFAGSVEQENLRESDL